MLIEITYNVTDVFMSTTETPVYVEISFEQPSGSAAVWGSITGTLSNQTDLQTALDAKLDESTIDGGTEGQILSKASATDFDFAWINNYAKYLATNVRNQSGSTIGAFQVVYISGATGNKPLISLADADTEATSSKTYGVTATAIANNGTGDVVTAGELSGINTSAFNEGDLLWLSTTAGGVVTSPPAEPAHAVFIGYVVRSHPTLGVIDVAIANGYELNELHGVQITTPTDNQGLFYNATSTLWENKSITTALGYTPVPTTRNITINGVTYDLSADRTYTISTGISGSGAAGQVTYWTGASSVSGSNNLFWDNANGRLGIGTNTPATRLSVTNTVSGEFISTFRASGSPNPSLNIEDGDITIPNFSTVGFNPPLTSNTIGFISCVSGSSGGLGFTGITNINGGNPLYFQGVSGKNSGNTNAIVTFVSGKHNNSTSVTSLAASEIPFEFVNWSSTIARFYGNGNLVLQNGGTFTDGGQRLQVYGDTLLRGSGNTSATTALTVQNSSSTNLLTVRNDGVVTIGSFNISNTIGVPTGTNNFISFTSSSYFEVYSGNGLNVRGNALVFLGTTSSFPSLRRSSADLIINDATNGFNTSLGVGVTTVDTSAKLQVDSTTKGFLPPRMTTTQKNAIATPAAGLVVYDTTDNKHYGYDGTTWNAFY